MSVDLTCQCQHGDFVNRDFYGRCMACHDTGRRLPTLDEWDALVAERDRYRKALEFIANSHRYPLCVDRARAALDGDA